MVDKKSLSRCPWGYKILLAALVVLPGAPVAATYWQVQTPEVTVIVDGDKADFSPRYSSFSASLRLEPDLHQIRVDLPDALPPIPEATAVAPETVEHLLKQLCGKLGQCRK